MASDVSFVGMNWASGWMHFVINPDNTLTPTGFAVKIDQEQTVQLGTTATDYPPGFTATDQQNFLVLANKLAREWSKAALKASSVTRQGQIYWETGFQPAQAPQGAAVFAAEADTPEPPPPE